jgi:restriction endonuclease Mrr
MRNNEVTAQDLRDIVEEAISHSIEMHRASRTVMEGGSYQKPSGPPTDEEIDDFVASNTLLDSETQEQLIDPGFLGFQAKTAQATPAWLRTFRRNVRDWAENQSWLAADQPWRNLAVVARNPTESTLWRPDEAPQPGWVATSPAALLLAVDLLHAGRLLSELPWRRFEELIGVLLEAEGWSVRVTQPSKDGGIDVIATKSDPIIGIVRAVWQAKRYGSARRVRLSEVRELSAVVDKERATKGIVVTTSRLTKDAIDWVRRDLYRLDYKDAQRVEAWVLRTAGRSRSSGR